jgi:hypothetical protein
MSQQNRHHEELEALLAGVVEGELSAQQTARLEALLHDDPAQREFYVRFMITHALLRWSHPGVGSNAKKETAAAGQSSALPASALPITDQPILDTGATPTVPGAAPTSLGTSGLGGSLFSYPVIFGFVLLLAIAAAAVLPQYFKAGPVAPSSPTDVAVHTEVPGNSAIVKAEIAAVAKMTAGENCQWGESTPGLRIGDGISIGQSLNLVSGVAEFTFDIGARVIVQSPASFSVDSSKSIRMQSGKLTAEITKAQARGFEVLTPEATFVDQGTEFGVEVAPGGSSRVHVFKGEVDLALSNKSGTALPTHRLLANSGARLEADASHVTLVEDTGESFVRSMDQAGRDLHTVAYWRFEDHPVGTLLPDTKSNTSVTRATVDSSFNGNDLFTYFRFTRPVFSEDVPSATVSQTGKANRTCLDNTEFPGPVSTRDVYTYSKFSHASPIDIQRISPAEWTIEASVKVLELGRVETFVGRDGSADVHANATPPLAFQITAEGHPVIRFLDVENRVHEAAASDFTLDPERWYHMAAVSDGRELRLYVNSLDGHGYRLLATDALPHDEQTALGTGGPEAVWTLGRGKAVNGVPGQWFKGWIDEVRISDIALEPTSFLFAEKNTNSTPQDVQASFDAAGTSGAVSKNK